MRARFRGVMKKYGYTAFGTYATVYVATWQVFCWGIHLQYIDVASIIGGVEPSAVVVTMLGPIMPEVVVSTIERTPVLTTMFVAWLGCKLFEPGRWAATIVLTPKVSQWWRARNYASPYLPIKKKKVTGSV
ncbi:hypothetical protein TeGR_g1230 [Tetraparma gracilis]|uniref:DUF1279 domain-containing protein n=1 Tax=Tetraparma gracilis TaxID=2962635 RepID=A0ABQ6MKL4_9STRA|nr:hypothetical protein TeGR_g1230 [Tetraparma gracilis]